MEKAAATHQALVLLAVLALAFLPDLADSQTRTMCITQLSLANQACSILPVWRQPIDPQDVPMHELHENAGDSDYGTDPYSDEPPSLGSSEPGHEPSLGSADGHGDRQMDGDYDDRDDGEHGGGQDQGRHGHGHGHGHGRRKRRQVHHSLVREECCRWLKEVDSPCLCEVLTRNLPRFLTRPHHDFSITVEDTCELTYRCQEF